MIERNDISKLWKQQHHFSRCTWSTISLSLPSLTSLQLSAIYLSPLGGETKIGKTNKAWLLDIVQKKCENVGPASYKGREGYSTSLWTLQLRPQLFQTSSNWGQTFGIGKSAQNWKKCAKLAETAIECEPTSTNRAKSQEILYYLVQELFLIFLCHAFKFWTIRVFFLSEMSSSLIIYVNQQAKEIIVHSPL